MKDGTTVHFGLSDRFAGAPIVVMDSAGVPPGQGQAQGQLTEDEKTDLVWQGMIHDISTSWQSPAPCPLPRSTVRDQRALARDQAAWAGAGSAPVVSGGQQGSGQVTQDDDPASAAHAQMVADMCSAWKTPSR